MVLFHRNNYVTSHGMFYLSSFVYRDSNTQIDNEVYMNGEKDEKGPVYDTIHGKLSIYFWPRLFYLCKNHI